MEADRPAAVVDCSVEHEHEHEHEVMSRGTLAGSKEWPGETAVWDATADKCLYRVRTLRRAGSR